LYTLATELEKRFSTPLDIEFCIQNGTIYFLQARPITQPIPEVVVYDNSNIQESYCGVTTPLTFSFAQRAYATVYRQTMHLILLPEKTIQAHEPVVTNLLGLVKGRIYYNINNWYRGLQLLPSFRQNKEDMERMMGVEEPVDFVTDRSKNLVEKISMLPSLMLNLLRLLKAFSQLKTSVPRFHAHFQQYYQRFYALPLADMPVEELYKEKELLDRELLHNWTTPIINDFYVMMMNGRVRRKLKKAGIANTDEFLSRYLSGDQQIESAQPAIQLQQLAVSAQSYEGLKKLILQLPGDVHQQVALRFPPFYKEVQVFINQYGDRTMGELKLETVTMRIEPLIFYKYLKNYLSAEDITLPQSRARLQQAARTELENALKQHTPFFRKSLFRDLEKLQQAIRFREGMRLERTRLFGMYRSVYLAIGEGLVGMGILKSSRAVFYLTEEEILNAKKHNAAALVQGRAAEFEAYRKEEVPSRVVIPSPPLERNNEQKQESGLKGTGCFAGIVSGEVVLVTGPEDAIDLNGKILCALRTDPGWVSLFPTCKAVLIEKGSSLSHSVILLREFGIPSIINIPRLTKTLKNGQFITINGTTGAIKIAENGNS
jgi:pyruvate,water dikinase